MQQSPANTDAILATYRETGTVAATARQLGLHYNTVRKIVLRDAGTCLCGKPLDSDHAACATCREYRRGITAGKRTRRSTAHTCIDCGGEIKARWVRCEPCRVIHRDRNARYHAVNQQRLSAARYDGNRIRALERDGHQCRLCHRDTLESRRLHVHHMDHSRTNHALDNLITLCISCHAMITRLATIGSEDRAIAWHLAFDFS